MQTYNLIVTINQGTFFSKLGDIYFVFADISSMINIDVIGS